MRSECHTWTLQLISSNPSKVVRRRRLQDALDPKTLILPVHLYSKIVHSISWHFYVFFHLFSSRHLFPCFEFVSLIAAEDLEAVIAQGWALAKCQGHSMAFALLAVDRVETRCLDWKD